MSDTFGKESLGTPIVIHPSCTAASVDGGKSDVSEISSYIGDNATAAGVGNAVTDVVCILTCCGVKNAITAHYKMEVETLVPLLEHEVVAVEGA